MSHLPEKHYDDFGHEAAVFDLDRAQGNIEEFFVHTASNEQFLKRDPSQPVIVGPKGSGKSLLIFKKLLWARSLSGVIALPRQPLKAFMPAPEFASLADAAYYWKLWKDGKPNLAAWGSLWVWALLRTTLSGWLWHEKRAREKSHHYEELLDLTSGMDNADPFVLISQYLQQLESGQHQNRGLLQVPDPAKLRQFATEHGSDYPPTYLFIDNHDDYYEQYPEFWRASCLGAFQAIQNLHQVSNRRLHCFLTLRPEVVWEIQKTQDYPKWGSDIFRIVWEDNELIELFKMRAKKLRPSLLREPDLASTNPLAALMGTSMVRDGERVHIRNVRIETDETLYEPVEQYLLRHTLRRPRDLIILGNHIINQIRQPTSAGASMPHRIREAIEQASGVIGNGYLAEIKLEWPWGMEEPGSLESFIRRYIRQNVISHDEAVRIQHGFAAELGKDPHSVHPMAELARMGIIGYPISRVNTEGRSLIQHFNKIGDTTSARHPRPDWYLVHPVLYGAPFYIPTLKGQVIGPGLPFDSAKLEQPPSRVEISTNSSPPKAPTSSVDQISPVFTWIHISDLHFGAGTIAHRFDQKAVMDAILRDVAENGPKRPDMIFITGDISFSAQNAQFEEAKNWLKKLASTAGVTIERVRVVPGNHDVNRSAIAQGNMQDTHLRIRQMPQLLDERLADEDARKILEKKFQAFQSFIQDLSDSHRALASSGLDWSEQFHLTDNQRRIRIVGLSSVWVSDDLDGRETRERSTPFVPNMVLGPGQVQKMLGHISDDELLFVLTHHPPEWLHQESADALSRALARLCHIHFCGHVHTSRAGVARRFGAPGRSVRYVAGAAHGDPSEEAKHGYAWGAVRWNPQKSQWEAGWAPRIYVREYNGMYAQSGPFDEDGFAWEPLELKWQA